MTQEPKVILSWIINVNEDGVNLTKWELSFMESITDQFNRKNWISDKQEEILERIYVEKTL